MLKRFTASLLVAVAATGCLKEKIEVTINADGSGKARFTQRFVGEFGEKMATALREEIEESKESGEDISAIMAKQELSFLKSISGGYTGIDAWDDVTVELTKDGVKASATGYFGKLTAIKNIRKNQMTGESKANQIIRLNDNADDTKTLEVIYSQGEDPTASADGPTEELSPEEKQKKEFQAGMLLGMMESLMKDVEMSTCVTIDGDVSTTENLENQDGVYVAKINFETIKKKVTEGKTRAPSRLTYKAGTTKRAEAFSKEFEAARASWARAQESFKSLSE